MIIFKHHGNLSRTTRFLEGASKINPRKILENYGAQGVAALAIATPKDTGLTSSSWAYEIRMGKGNYTLSWTNSNIVSGAPIAILIQYGHGTRNGAYVQGRDYINPAMKPILESIASNIWKEVTKL